MGKMYEKNGDVILSQDHKDLCRLAEYLYAAVDEIFVLEDNGLDLHPLVQVYRDAARQMEELIGVPMEETLRRYI